MPLHESTPTLSRSDAEAQYAQGASLGPHLIQAITRGAPDASFTTGCDPKQCDPQTSPDFCQPERTTQERTASLAVDGWCTRQQHYRETSYDLHQWAQGRCESVEPAFEGAEYEAATMVWTLTDRLADGDHLQHYTQQYWFAPNLLVIATSSPKYPTTVHTLTPRDVRTYNY